MMISIDKETLAGLGKLTSTAILGLLLAYYMYLNHIEKSNAQIDKDNTYRSLLERQTKALENIERAYLGK